MSQLSPQDVARPDGRARRPMSMGAERRRHPSRSPRSHRPAGPLLPQLAHAFHLPHASSGLGGAPLEVFTPLHVDRVSLLRQEARRAASHQRALCASFSTPIVRAVAEPPL